MEKNRPTDGKASASRTGSRGWVKFWVAHLALTGLLLFLYVEFGSAPFPENLMQMVYGLVWITVVSAWIAFGGKLREQAKHAFIWAVIVLVLLAGYSYRNELKAVKDRLLFNLVPEIGFAPDDRSMRFAIADDGHFYVRATIGGAPVRFLVDTGASHIVITPRDAERIGFDPDRLTFSRIYSTANGTVRGAPVTLPDFTLGDLRLANVPASVNQAPMATSLLGMSFFNRLKSYEVSGRQLTLRWAPNP